MAFPGHKVDPGEGAYGYVVSIGKYLSPNQGYCLLSHLLSVLNLLTQAAKVDFWRSYKIGQFQSYGWSLPKFNFHPTDERPEANQWTLSTEDLGLPSF